MKEKTFEELMNEYTVNMDGVTTYYLQPKTVLALMQQVREATIAECKQYIEDNPEIALDFTRGREIKIDIPKDRILTP